MTEYVYGIRHPADGLIFKKRIFIVLKYFGFETCSVDTMKKNLSLIILSFMLHRLVFSGCHSQRRVTGLWYGGARVPGTNVSRTGPKLVELVPKLVEPIPNHNFCGAQ